MKERTKTKRRDKDKKKQVKLSFYIEKFVITNLRVFMASKVQYVHNWWSSFNCSVVDPDPNPDPDPRVFEPPDPDPDSLVRGMDPDPDPYLYPDPDLDPSNFKQK
jgi:hypothetical protein